MPVAVTVRETVPDLLCVGLPLGVRVPVFVPVNVGSPERVPLRVGVVEPVGEAVFEGVPVGDAPADGVAVGDAVTEAVLVALLVTEGVRVAVTDAVFEALGVGGGQEGVAPSSSLRIRLLFVSAIHNVEPATAMPEGELNLAAVPSAKPAPSPATAPTTTSGQAVTSAITRRLWFVVSAT